MGKHLTPEQKKRIHELFDQGLSRQRICLRLNVSDNQVMLELRKAKKKFPNGHIKHGLKAVYDKLQGGNR